MIILEVFVVCDVDRIIGFLEVYEFYNFKFIINRIRFDMVKCGDMMDIDDILEIFLIEFFGIIFDDEKIIIFINKGEFVVMDEKLKVG